MDRCSPVFDDNFAQLLVAVETPKFLQGLVRLHRQVNRYRKPGIHKLMKSVGVKMLLDLPPESDSDEEEDEEEKETTRKSRTLFKPDEVLRVFNLANLAEHHQLVSLHVPDTLSQLICEYVSSPVETAERLIAEQFSQDAGSARRPNCNTSWLLEAFSEREGSTLKFILDVLSNRGVRCVESDFVGIVRYFVQHMGKVGLAMFIALCVSGYARSIFV